MNASESAEEIVKMSLEGLEVAARITGTGVERIAVALYTMSKDKTKSKGKTTLNNMLKSGGELRIFSLKESDLKKFNDVSKQYGILYTALFNKKVPNEDGLVDVMVRSQDASRVNRIVEKFNLSTVDIASIKTEIEKDKIEEMLNDAKERGVEVKSDEEKLADEILSKPIKKEENEVSNPNVAKTEKSPLSEPLSKTKNKEGVASKTEVKHSVRKDLEKIRQEMKDKELSKGAKEKDDRDNKKDYKPNKKHKKERKDKNGR